MTGTNSAQSAEMLLVQPGISIWVQKVHQTNMHSWGPKSFGLLWKVWRKTVLVSWLLKDENFTLITENIQKAGLLNKQFESVFTQEN